MTNSGQTLVGTISALAALSLLLLGVVTLYGKVVGIEVSADRSSQVEHLVHLLQDQLANPAVCRSAFQDVNGNALTWPNTSANLTVGQIAIGGPKFITRYRPPMYVADNNSTGAAAMRLVFNAATLRLADPAKNEGEPATSQIKEAVEIPATATAAAMTKYTTVNVMTAKLQLDFSNLTMTTSGSAYQPLPPRMLDMVFKMDAAGKILSCFDSRSIPLQNASCPAYDGSALCPVQAPRGCSLLQYVYGFTGDSKPLCSCAVVCSRPPIGPPGKYVRPPPPPSSGCGSRMGCSAPNHAAIGDPSEGGEGGDGGEGGEGEGGHGGED